ncbi:hypothetical protein LJC61_02790 [Ruminococcaceae bacterium OttesenSCG-928-A16]|nr:hypothetical protein [Ruminococcaceae bacterium OttesenSCG-928-A16]
MRKFKLINSAGREFNLMRTDAFFAHPDGLGISRETSFLQAGENFIKTMDTGSQKRPSGEMVFKAYAQYMEFVKFCSDAPLKLCYNAGADWWYLDCDISYLGKTEIEPATNRLICPIDFAAYGVWYNKVTIAKTGSSQSAAKKYRYKYPYTYADGASGAVAIESNNTMDSPCRLYIYGPCQNPRWTLSQKGKVVSTGKAFVKVGADEFLSVNSKGDVMEMALYDRATLSYRQNIYGLSDFSTQRFIYIPNGRSVLTFSHDGTSAIEAIVEVSYIAETV